MNFGKGWLGQVPLLRGPALGAPAPKPRKKLGQLSCCNAPDGKGYCFDTGSGECVMTWVSSATGSPDTPACVQDSRGQWVLPSCVGQEARPSGGRPPLPPGCTYAGHESNQIQEVICECYNCTTRKSDGWRGMLSDFIAMGSKNPCLRTPEWFPKPAQCPAGPGGGGSYTPPAPGPTLPTTPLPGGGISAMPTPGPSPTLPVPTAGPTPTPTAAAAPSPTLPLPDQSGLNSGNRSFCGPSGGPFTIVEVDPVSGDPIRVVARDIPFGDPNYEWTGLVTNPPWCADFLSSGASPSPGTQQPPAAAPTPTPALPTTPINEGLPQMGPLPTQTMTYPAVPTGLPYGSPYPAPAAPRSYPQQPSAPAAAPLPTQPIACPTGPIKVADWSKGCVGNALRRLS